MLLALLVHLISIVAKSCVFQRRRISKSYGRRGALLCRSLNLRNIVRLRQPYLHAVFWMNVLEAQPSTPAVFLTGHQKRRIGHVGPRLASISPRFATAMTSPCREEFFERMFKDWVVTLTQPYLLVIA